MKKPFLTPEQESKIECWRRSLATVTLDLDSGITIHRRYLEDDQRFNGVSAITLDQHSIEGTPLLSMDVYLRQPTPGRPELLWMQVHFHRLNLPNEETYTAVWLFPEQMMDEMAELLAKHINFIKRHGNSIENFKSFLGKTMQKENPAPKGSVALLPKYRSFTSKSQPDPSTPPRISENKMNKENQSTEYGGNVGLHLHTLLSHHVVTRYRSRLSIEAMPAEGRNQDGDLLVMQSMIKPYGEDGDNLFVLVNLYEYAAVTTGDPLRHVEMVASIYRPGVGVRNLLFKTPLNNVPLEGYASMFVDWVQFIFDNHGRYHVGSDREFIQAMMERHPAPQTEPIADVWRDLETVQTALPSSLLGWLQDEANTNKVELSDLLRAVIESVPMGKVMKIAKELGQKKQ